VLVDVKCDDGDVTTSPACMRAVAKGVVDGIPATKFQGDTDAEIFSIYAMGKSRPVLLQKSEPTDKAFFRLAMYTNAVHWFKYKPARRDT
jgi:hypothetical protein